MALDSSTFLVLGDIHFGALAVSNDFALSTDPPLHGVRGAVPMKDALITTVRKHADQLSGILVPGDLTSIAAPGEFRGSVKAVNEIAAALKVEEKNVFFTFGNHDVDWRISAMSEIEDKDPLYNVVAASTGSLFVWSHPTEKGPVPGSGVFVRDAYTIFSVNSGYHCYKKQDYRHGKIGEIQIRWLGQMLKQYHGGGLRIVMVHHHPFKYPFATLLEDISCLEEGAELVELIATEGVHLVCHGHRHEPKIFTEMRNTWRHAMTFLCAGSVAVNEKERNRGEIPNLFHLLFVERQLPSGAAFGRVLNFQYRSATGWTPTQHGPSTPIDHIQFFGAVANSNEKHQAATQIVREASTQASAASKSALLPDLNALPPELQCMFTHELNKLFNEIAKEAGAHLFGKYPDNVLIKF